MTVQPQCDFCDSKDVQWTYPCQDFGVVGVNTDTGTNVGLLGSAGAWAACETCAALIEAGRWQALAERSVATSPTAKQHKLSPDERALLIRLTKEMHEAFRQGRKMERLAYG